MQKGRAVFLLALVLAIFCFGALRYSPPLLAQGLSEEEKARLRTEYDKLQSEIVEWQKILDDTRAKKNTLTGDVTALNAQIKQAEVQIKQKNVAISNIAGEINQKTKHISGLELRINEGRQSLAKLLRQKNEGDSYPLAALVLGGEGLSSFFANMDAINSIDRALQERFEELRSVKAETETERAALDEKRNQELDAKYVVEVKKNQIAQNEKEKKQLLNITKEQERSYQTVLAERQQRAEQIRTALFDLRDTQGISFSRALEYAEYASQKTGVRAALILAILSQESDLGKNIGSCFVTDIATGDGVGKNTGSKFEKVMKAPRDTEPFLEITESLGLTWATTPVSCPLGKTYSSSRGYGGAMGPSQFIPSTWELYIEKLKNTLGVSLPNPWDPKHAIMATALYMQGLGADGGTYTTERNAACRYYSGRSCDSRKPTNYTYGDSVLNKAKNFQENIDFLRSI